MADELREIGDLTLLPSAEASDTFPVERDGLAKRLSLFSVIELVLSTDEIEALVTGQANRLMLDGSNIGANGSALRAAIGLAYADLPFLAVPVGGLLALPTHLTGVAEPGTGSSLFRFAKLTAGLTGSGAYNDGVLGSESVSGSAPLVVATASVTLTGSPINGQSIRLLNTEGRFIRPGTTSGTVRDSQVQDHIHLFPIVLSGSTLSSTDNAYDMPAETGASRTFLSGAIHNDGVIRYGTDTYPKHVELTHYMRVK